MALSDHGKYAGVVDIARNGVDEVIRLKDLLGKANALCRVRDARIKEIEAEQLRLQGDMDARLAACDALVRQMLEVIECQNGPRDQEELAPITAARAWLESATPQQPDLVPLAAVLARVDACAGPGSAVRLALEREFGQPAA